MSNQEQTTTIKLNDFWTDTMKKIIAVQDRFENKVKSMGASAGKSFQGIQNRLQKFKVQNMEAISGIVSEIPGADRAISLMSNPYVAAGAAAVGAGVAISKATQYAIGWEKQLAEANVTAQVTKAELQGISDKLKLIGGRNVPQLTEVPKTFNNILSAGLSVNESMTALEPTLRAAKAGFTDAAIAADAGVGIMNSSGESITKVYDILFRTVDKGKAEFKDIAQYLPKIVPAARQAGMALFETAGAWAYLTAQGNTAERSTTLMENFTKVLTNTDRIEAFKKIGVAIYDNNGKILPIVKIIEQLQGKLKGLTDKEMTRKLGSLGLDQEAMGAFASMTQNVDKLKETIEATENSAGAANDAYNNAKTSTDDWAIVSNRLSVIWLNFGEKFLPIVTKAGQWVLDTIDYFENLNSKSIIFRDGMALLSGVLSHTIQLSMTGLHWLGNLYDNTIGKLFRLIDGQNEASKSFTDYYMTVRPYLVWIFEMLGKISDVFLKIVHLDLSGAFDAIKNFTMPDMEKIRKDQQEEQRKMWVNNVMDVSLPKKGLTPQKKDPFSGLDLKADGKDKKGRGAGSSGVSGGSGARDVTINIQNLLPGVTVNVTNVKEAAGDLGKLIQEELLKMMADVTLAVE